MFIISFYIRLRLSKHINCFLFNHNSMYFWTRTCKQLIHPITRLGHSIRGFRNQGQHFFLKFDQMRLLVPLLGLWRLLILYGFTFGGSGPRSRCQILDPVFNKLIFLSYDIRPGKQNCRRLISPCTLRAIPTLIFQRGVLHEIAFQIRNFILNLLK